MLVVKKKISLLIPASYNPRKISEAGFEQLKKSLQKFEAVEPAIINTREGRENTIVGGHQRIKAAKALGWAEFPCVEVDLSEADERELNLRLNRNTGDWDLDVLLAEFDTKELLEFGFDEKEITFADITFDAPSYEDAEEGKAQIKVSCLKKDVPNVKKAIEAALSHLNGVRLYA